MLTLPPYGFYGFMQSQDEAAPEWSSKAPPSAPAQHIFVLRERLLEVAAGGNCEVLERKILPDYVARRRWFAGKDAVLRGVRLASAVELPGRPDLVLAEIEVDTERETASYVLPLGIAWEEEVSGPDAPDLALARVRRGRRAGLLTDGFAVPEFARAVVDGLRASREIAAGNGTIRFLPGEEFDLPESAAPEWIAPDQSNSSLILGRRAVVKLLRRIQPGIHPEVEMTRYLRASGFAGVPPLLGEVVRTGADGEPHTLMIVQGFVDNQGDGWQWTQEMLSRRASEADERACGFENYGSFAETLGVRLAEMHALLAQPSDDPAFAPETVGEDEVEALAARVCEQVAGLAGFEHLPAAIGPLARHAVGKVRTRVHGDLHLGQLLVAGGEVMLVDFEGEPARPLAQRRAKDLPLRDVAGLLRSFDYAAAAALLGLPADQAFHHRLGEIFERFRDSAVAAFLRGYAKVAGDPRGPLLDLYLLEKAAYEVRYEAANRPDWIDIPMAGLRRIVDRVLGASG